MYRGDVSRLSNRPEMILFLPGDWEIGDREIVLISNLQSLISNLQD
jgi:hypothetical protein